MRYRLFLSSIILCYSLLHLFEMQRLNQRHQEIKRQYEDMKKKEDHRRPRFIIDWPNLVKIWMLHARACHLKILRIAPSLSMQQEQQFSLYVQGHYLNFFQWLEKIQDDIPNLRWNKMVIHVSKDHYLYFKIYGFQYESR